MADAKRQRTMALTGVGISRGKLNNVLEIVQAHGSEGLDEFSNQAISRTLEQFWCDFWGN